MAQNGGIDAKALAGVARNVAAVMGRLARDAGFAGGCGAGRPGRVAGGGPVPRTRPMPAGPAPAPPRPPTAAPAGVPPGLADHPQYEVVRELGRGGMGVVYLARNRLLARDEVLK